MLQTSLSLPELVIIILTFYTLGMLTVISIIIAKDWKAKTKQSIMNSTALWEEEEE